MDFFFSLFLAFGSFGVIIDLNCSTPKVQCYRTERWWMVAAERPVRMEDEEW